MTEVSKKIGEFNSLVHKILQPLAPFIILIYKIRKGLILKNRLFSAQPSKIYI